MWLACHPQLGTYGKRSSFAEGRVAQIIWNWRSAAVPAAARSTTPKPVEFRALIGNSGCGGWDTRAPFHLGNTPLTLPPFSPTPHQGQLERISFKGSLDALRQYSTAMAQAPNRKLRRALWDDLLLNLARDLVPLRPNRREPRAVKRRPKAYPLLNQPRRRFIEISHRSRYWKGRPRNYRDLN